MAKPTALTPDALMVETPTPTAATPARGARPGKAARLVTEPMQIRVSRPEGREIRVGAAQAERSISRFVVDAVRWYVKSGQHVASMEKPKPRRR